MRATSASALALALIAVLPRMSLECQAIRRPQPRAFRVSVTPYLGPGWGGARAVATDPFNCSAIPCVTHRLSASPVAGVEVHVPLPGTIALGLVLAAGRPNRVSCELSVCLARGRVTVIQGGALLLWRFRTRAPMYVGFGPAFAHVSPGPVFSQRSAATELGGLVLAAYDVRFTSAIGARLAWWNYFLAPSGVELTPSTSPRSVVWESKITAGVTFSFGSPTVRRPPRTFGG